MKFIALVLFATNLAFAEPFTDIQSLFSQGNAPAPSEFIGWTSGRCYNHAQPSTPIASVLVAETRQVGGEHGPLFPPKNVSKILLVSSPNSKADAYDAMTPSEKIQLEAMITTTFPSISEMKLTKNSYASDYVAGKLKYRLRKAGNYLLALNVLLEDAEGLMAGEVYFACYYFNKLQ